MLGQCKWFSKEKSFGFLQPDDGGKDVFIHISQLMKAHLTDLKEGQRVEFDMQLTKKGYEAVNLRVI